MCVPFILPLGMWRAPFFPLASSDLTNKVLIDIGMVLHKLTIGVRRSRMVRTTWLILSQAYCLKSFHDLWSLACMLLPMHKALRLHTQSCTLDSLHPLECLMHNHTSFGVVHFHASLNGLSVTCTDENTPMKIHRKDKSRLLDKRMLIMTPR